MNRGNRSPEEVVGDRGREEQDGDGGESSMHDRSIQLADNEMKALSGTYKSGEEAQCLVTGRINHDGKFDIISVEPVGDKGGQQGSDMSQMMSPQVPASPNNPY